MKHSNLLQQKYTPSEQKKKRKALINDYKILELDISYKILMFFTFKIMVRENVFMILRLNYLNKMIN